MTDPKIHHLDDEDRVARQREHPTLNELLRRAGEAAQRYAPKGPGWAGDDDATPYKDKSS